MTCRAWPELGLDLDQATQQLEDEGVEKFNQPYDSLMATLEGKRREVLSRGKPCPFRAAHHPPVSGYRRRLAHQRLGPPHAPGCGAKKFGLDHDDLNERHQITFDTYEEGKLDLDTYLNHVLFYRGAALYP